MKLVGVLFVDIPPTMALMPSTRVIQSYNMSKLLILLCDDVTPA